jgi:TM2 domain-containing membrane protein YozV
MKQKGAFSPPFFITFAAMNLEKKNCPSCGAPITSDQYLCANCDANRRDIFAAPAAGAPAPKPQGDQNRWLITLLLCWFLGTFGVHRFYTGHIGIGVAQVLTLGGCGIWALIDLIIILTGNFKDAEGNPIKA